MASSFKKTEVKLELLTDVDMLLMVEKGIRGGMCHAIDRYASRKYMWMDRRSSQFNKDFIKKYNEESDEGYFLKVDIQYPEKLCELHNDLPFLPEMKFEKVKKLVTNLHDKTEYVIHIRNLKQALNHGLILKNFHRVIKFNQKAWLKPNIDMNAKLRQKAKDNFEKHFFKLIIMQFLEKLSKTSENKEILNL